MTSQNLIVVFRNNVIDYVILILDTDMKEEEVKIITRKRQLVFRQRNLHEEVADN